MALSVYLHKNDYITPRTWAGSGFKLVERLFYHFQITLWKLAKKVTLLSKKCRFFRGKLHLLWKIAKINLFQKDLRSRILSTEALKCFIRKVFLYN